MGWVTRRNTAAEREELIHEYRVSGLSRSEFAQRKGINGLGFGIQQIEDLLREVSSC